MLFYFILKQQQQQEEENPDPPVYIQFLEEFTIHQSRIF
jgi:hypothetical protein